MKYKSVFRRTLLQNCDEQLSLEGTSEWFISSQMPRLYRKTWKKIPAATKESSLSVYLSVFLFSFLLTFLLSLFPFVFFLSFITLHIKIIVYGSGLVSELVFRHIYLIASIKTSDNQIYLCLSILVLVSRPIVTCPFIGWKLIILTYNYNNFTWQYVISGIVWSK